MGRKPFGSTLQHASAGKSDEQAQEKNRLLVGRRVSLPPGKQKSAVGTESPQPDAEPVDRRPGTPSPSKAPFEEFRPAPPPRQMSAPPTQHSPKSPTSGRTPLSSTVVSGTAPAFLHSRAPRPTSAKVEPSHLGSTLAAVSQEEDDAQAASTQAGETGVESVRLYDSTASEAEELPIPSSRFGWETIEELGDLNQSIQSTRQPQSRESRLARKPNALPQVGDYEVLARLQKGGMSTIYLCRRRSRTGFERLFAMKVLRTDLESELDVLVRSFFREAQLLANCHNPHVIGVVDVGTMEEPYLVLDYVEGGSLHELCEKNPSSRPPELISRILLDALTGLSALHRTEDAAGHVRGIIHCDLTPHNLLVGIDGRCRVSDLGIAVSGHEISTGERPLVGKPSYLAPERIRGEHFDERADLFSLGVVAYDTLTGQDPFRARTSAQTLENVLELEPLPPSEAGFCPHPAFDWWCMKALAKNPDSRFQTADEMRAQLERIVARQNWSVPPARVAEWVSLSLQQSLAARRDAAQGERSPVVSPEGGVPGLEADGPASESGPPTERPEAAASEREAASTAAKASPSAATAPRPEAVAPSPPDPAVGEGREMDLPAPTASRDSSAAERALSAWGRFQLLPASTQVLWVIAWTLGALILGMLALLLFGR